MLCMKHVRPPSVPFLGQSIGVPLVMIRNGGKQGDREWLEVELAQYVIDHIGFPAVFMNAKEGVAGGIHRQRRDVESLTVGRDGGDTGCDAKTNVAELAQLLSGYHGVDLLGVRSLRIKNGFCIVEDDEHLA